MGCSRTAPVWRSSWQALRKWPTRLPACALFPSLSRVALYELDEIRHAYPLASGAVVRASFPGWSASGFKDALANADRDCAEGIASVMQGSASGSPSVADLLGRLSFRPGALGAVLAAAAAASRRADV